MVLRGGRTTFEGVAGEEGGKDNECRRRERTHPLLVARSPAAAAFPLLLLVGNTRLVCVTVMTPPSESVEGKTVLEGVGVALV